ncbi:hypothetical protein [Alteromonas flava]|uniref:hypothetical protein n=1 Tax=Alteromonas flava TaxID=2048003 RepID=UPI000C284DBF|nr:hypothetical protein [Alteromonas flava]
MRNLRTIKLLYAKDAKVGLIEAILAGLLFERLQKPIVFFTMLIGFLFFSLAGIAIFYAVFETLISEQSKVYREFPYGPLFGMVAFSFVFWGLAAICGHMIKKCIR